MRSQIEIVKKYGLPVRGHLGQHLLADPNIARKIVRLVDPQPGDWILEIGPGLGALSWELLKYPVTLVGVEKDKRFAALLETEWAERRAGGEVHPQARAEWRCADFLRFDLAACLADAPQAGRRIAVSNLPYYITAPCLFHLIENRTGFDRAVLMMQKEVAKRLSAKAGTKDYGRLTLAVQNAGSARSAFDVPPGCFIPRPKVDSSVVDLRFLKPGPGFSEEDKRLEKLIQVAFAQRRKALAGLLAAQGLVPDRETARRALAKAGLPEAVRGEKLILKDFRRLAEILGTRP